MALPKAGVKAPKDLAGKRVATAGIPYQTAYLKTILEKAGVDPGSVKETNVGFNLVPAMVSGKADATLGAFWNVEGVQLQRQGRKPGDPEDAGPRRPDLQRADLRRPPGVAGRRGRVAAAALHHRHRGGRAARARRPEGRRRRADRGRQGAGREDPGAPARGDDPDLLPEESDQPWGWMEPVDWANYERWMRANQLLKRPPSEAPPLTNEFLPGEGLGSSSRG